MSIKLKPTVSFSNSEWKRSVLGEVSDIQTGPFGSQLHEKDYVDEGTPIITVEHFGENKVLHKNLPLVSDADKERLKKYTLKKGDVVFSRVGSVDRRVLISEKEDGWLFSGRCLRVRVKDKNLNNEFISNYLGTTKCLNEIRSKAVGGTMPSLNTNILKSISITYPSKEDQQRISSFFALFNNKIEKQQEKIEKLEELKKGMMQKVFSREIRFKDENGEEFLSWNAIRFEDVVEKLIGGGTPSRKVEEYYGGDIPWVTVKDLKANKYISEAEEHITELGLKNSSSKIVDKDDLIIPTRMAVGRIVIAKENVAINQDLKGCKLKTGYDTEFIYYLYASKSTAIERLASGSTVTGINIEDLMKIKLGVPTLKEQEKIAGYLCSLDIKLEKEKSKFKLLVEQKEGFMQRMFV